MITAKIREKTLTSPTLVHTVKIRYLAILRQSDQSQQSIELVSSQSELPTSGTSARRNDRHNTGLVVRADMGSGQCTRHAASRDLAGIAAVPDNGIKDLNIALRHI